MVLSGVSGLGCFKEETSFDGESGLKLSWLTAVQVMANRIRVALSWLCEEESCSVKGEKMC